MQRTPQKRAREKRAKLLTAAREVFEEQGYSQATLSEIARVARVPLGNVYYYFRTKEELLASVLEQQTHQLVRAFEAREGQPVTDRVRWFFSLDSEPAPLLDFVRCAALASEAQLADVPAIHEEAREVLELVRRWLEGVLQRAGRGDAATELTNDALCAAHGALLLSHSLGAPELAREGVARARARLCAALEGLDAAAEVGAA